MGSELWMRQNSSPAITQITLMRKIRIVGSTTHMNVYGYLQLQACGNTQHLNVMPVFDSLDLHQTHYIALLKSIVGLLNEYIITHQSVFGLCTAQGSRYTKGFTRWRWRMCILVVVQYCKSST